MLIDIMIFLLQRWVDLFLEGYRVWGFICGFCLLSIWLLRRSRLWVVFTWPTILSAAISIPLLVALPDITEALGGKRISVPDTMVYWFVGGLVAPSLSLVLLSRYGGQLSSWLASLIIKPFSRQRTVRTDVRTISQALPPELKSTYDPENFFAPKKGIFIGLDAHKKPIYMPTKEWRSSHIQTIGTTGSGKGVITGVLLAQALQQGESVIVVDPKSDEFLPAVLASRAKKENVPFVYIDLLGSKAQWNPFFSKSEQEIEELLTAGLGMGDVGTDADVYRTEDRRVARRFAVFCKNNPGPIHKQFGDFFEENQELVEGARKFYADLEELIYTSCIKADSSIDLATLIEARAVIYVRGSTRNPRILKLQKVFLLSCMQIIESRNRDIARHVIIFLDEFKYVISRPAIEALGAIRDKGAHVILAHQSLGDLEDCGNDLSARAVIGAVVENCAIKIAYKARDPDTAIWLSKLSGSILVDDETRIIELNLGLTEKQGTQRNLRQADYPLIDVNKLIMLPYRSAVLFGLGPAQFIYTSPIRVDKAAFKIEAVGEEVKPFAQEQSLAGSLLNVD